MTEQERVNKYESLMSDYIATMSFRGVRGIDKLQEELSRQMDELGVSFDNDGQPVFVAPKDASQ